MFKYQGMLDEALSRATDLGNPNSGDTMNDSRGRTSVS